MASIYDKASLVLIPSGTKTSKVYSQKPTNGDGDFTFSRSTAATRVNADGNIEKETQNLLLQSNQFDTTWGNTNITITGGQSDRDGGSNAWKFDINGGTAAQNVRQGVSNSGVTTFSLYLKAGTLNWSLVQVLDGGSNPAVYFDLQNGAVGNITGGAIDASIEAAGNGYYRCSIQANGNITQARIYPATADNNITQSSGYIFGQDAQLEQGLVARDYIETTTTAIYGGITDNVPRLDYQGSCPALLLEPQRTNLLPQSEYFGGSDWTRSGHTLTNNTTDTLSPEGKYNAAKVTATNTDPYLLDFVGVVTGDVTFSVYVKAAGAAIGRNCSIHIDFSAGTAGGTNVTQGFQPTAEWQRIDVKGTATSSGTTRVRMELGNLAVVGDEYFIFGAQLEAGSYATSYIPTYGSAVTRNADTTDDLDTSSLLTQSNNNTFFGEVVNHRNTGNTRFIASYDSARDNGDRILIYTGNGSSDYTLHCQYKVSGETSVQFNIKTGVSYGDTIKFAVVFNGTQMIGFANGVKTATATIVDADNFNKFDITDVANEGGVYKQLIVFPTALTDQEAIDLTTL